MKFVLMLTLKNKDYVFLTILFYNNYY